MQRRIPSLDGLRALGLACVLLAHSLRLPVGNQFRAWVFGMGNLALSVFFFISGYLITRQLLENKARHGVIDLRSYYLRRVFRIVPTYYVFLAVVGFLAITDWKNIFTAATFTFGYSPWSSSGFVAHTWTLSIEEQFYILWPLTLLYAGAKRSVKVALVLIALAPLFRLGQYTLSGDWRWLSERALHTRIDALMSGCCIALIEGKALFERLARRLLRPAFVVFCGSFLVLISPVLGIRFGSLYRLPLGYTLETAAIAITVIYLKENPEAGVGRFLNWRPVVHVGLISYSVYLWQQIFLVSPEITLFSPAIDAVVRRFPANLVLALFMGEVSYRTVEAWSLRARRRLEGRMEPRVAAAAAD